MKQTINSNEFAQAFRDYDRFGAWSYAGLTALFDFLEEMEQDTGEEMELDVIALDCEYSEWEDLEEWARGYFIESNYQSEFHTLEDEELEDAIREYIHDNGQLIEFDGGIIVSSF